jgi:DNA-binding GntR family transcriptional regulator
VKTERLAQAKSLSEVAYDVLKRKIIEREFGPNTKLDIEDLTREMGISRMPLLDAITRLKSEGLLISRHRVGTYVAPLDKSVINEVFEARHWIEQSVTPKCILQIRDQDVLELRDLLQKSNALLTNVTEDRFDYRQFIEYDQKFHLSLLRLCRNTRMIECYLSLNSHIQIGRIYSLQALERSREGQMEHEEILSAFAARDVERAQRAQQAHLERSRQGILRLLEERGLL